jgi:AcrR family transcriptional regulator
MPRSSPAHAAEVRQRILDGADRAFRNEGFRGASLPDIALEAGVSVGLIYRYFPSKEELFLTVCQSRTDAQLNELASALAGIPDPRQRLATAIGTFVTSLTDEHWGPIIVHAWAEADRNPRLRDMLIRLFDQQRGFAAMFIREAIARHEAPPDLDVESLSLAAAILLDGAIAYQAERGSGFDAEAVSRALTDLLGTPLRGPHNQQASNVG